jgi:hypothetical protein
VWRWAGAADGTQPGGEVQGTQWAQLTQEEGKARGKAGPDDEAAGLAQDGGVLVEGQLW